MKLVALACAGLVSASAFALVGARELQTLTATSKPALSQHQPIPLSHAQQDATRNAALEKPATAIASHRGIVLKADARGHFIAPVSVNGTRLPMLVDTGASFVALSQEDARAAAIWPSGHGRVPVSTANGIVMADKARLRDVRIGDIVLDDVETLIMPPGAMRGSLLGMSFLKRLKSFHIAQGQLLLDRESK
jgi:aspartyl protease family protein